MQVKREKVSVSLLGDPDAVGLTVNDSGVVIVLC